MVKTSIVSEEIIESLRGPAGLLFRTADAVYFEGADGEVKMHSEGNL